MTTTKQYDRLNRLKSISSIGGASSGSPILSSFDYQYNQANQRVKATLEDGSAWDYAYESLGQVTSGKKLLANRAPEPDEAFDYQHDDIGNRKEAGGKASSRISYLANALNQYTQRVDTQAPNKTETLQYDTDGNLIADEAWKYTWDAENRLVAMESGPSVSPEQRQRLEFSYDSQSRRISKKVYDWESARSNFSLQPSAFSLFVYDGWNLLAELTSDLRPLSSFVWGLDLSGSQQGAGGVGGLLFISNRQAGPGNSHAVVYDGSGNVIALVDAQTGNISAQYNHGPFGELIQSTGSMAKSNPFRFSTKYTDDETVFVYYGYRYYRPSMGKWLSRDPIEEKGGVNLYGIVNNCPITLGDGLGLSLWNAICCKDDCSPEGQVMVISTKTMILPNGVTPAMAESYATILESLHNTDIAADLATLDIVHLAIVSALPNITPALAALSGGSFCTIYSKVEYKKCLRFGCFPIVWRTRLTWDNEASGWIPYTTGAFLPSLGYAGTNEANAHVEDAVRANLQQVQNAQ